MAPFDSKTRITDAARPGSAARRGARVIVFSRQGVMMERELDEDEAEIRIGRGRECDLHIDDESVSHTHALLRPMADSWELVDLNSTNGSFIGDEAVQRADLRDGDVIRMGRITLKFLDGRGVESSYHEELRRRSERDPFTGTYNRAFAQAVLATELARPSSERGAVAIALLDIDDFKRLNDDHGHLAGDAVLVSLGSILIAQAGSSALVARFGGEEFVVIFTTGDLEAARRWSERLCDTIAKHSFTYADRELPVTVSIGLASIEPGPEATAEILISRADRNLYEAKRRGKNCVVCQP